jgi:hypothetical protein
MPDLRILRSFAALTPAQDDVTNTHLLPRRSAGTAGMLTLGMTDG